MCFYLLSPEVTAATDALQETELISLCLKRVGISKSEKVSKVGVGRRACSQGLSYPQRGKTPTAGQPCLLSGATERKWVDAKPRPPPGGRNSEKA